jgi:hypothetical protein
MRTEDTGITDAEIVEWIICETNRHASRFDGISPKARVDISLAGSHNFPAQGPGFRIARDDLAQFIELDIVRRVTKELTK